jgi:integrase
VKLTAKKISKLLKQPGRYGDGHGLVLEVTSLTNASWLLRYQRHGRERWYGLGPVHTFSLQEARERARAARQLLQDGIDPIEQKRAIKAQQVAEAARVVTFGECATDYYRAHSPGWTHEKHAAQWRATVLGLTLSGRPAEGDHCRILRPLPVQSIDTPLILSVLKPHWLTKTETMSRVRARIASVLDYAKACGYRQGDNPASWDVIGKLLPSPGKIATVEHFAAIDYRQIPAFVAALRQREGVAARALEFLVYTSARTAEVLNAVWGEIDLDGALWEIPAERMKAERPHKVPLAPEAIVLLRNLYSEGDGDDGFLFIGPQPGKPLSETSLRAVMRRMGRAEVPHGLRSSFSDWAHESTGYSNHTIEISLAHSIGAAAEKAYRRGAMLEKRRKLMAAWARYCTSPPVAQTAEGKVVSMRGQS